MRELQCLTLMASAAASMLFATSVSGQTATGGSRPVHEHAAPDAGFKLTPAPADAYVYIGWPNDGQTVRTTHIKVWFGTPNFGVALAGTDKPNTGHHHLLIDTALPPMDQPIPSDEKHLHFGLGQTETIIDLPPGTHTLQLLMGDGNHIPHNPPLMSKKITIHVQAAEGQTAGGTN